MNPETALEKLILLEMSKDGIMAHHQYHGKYCPYHAKNSVIDMGIDGMADILPVVSTVITQDMVGKRVGLAVNVEVKTAGGKQQDNQKLYQQAYERAGGIYVIVRSVDDWRKEKEAIIRGDYFQDYLGTIRKDSV